MRKKIRGILGLIIVGIISMTFVSCQDKEDNKEIIISIAASLQKPMNKIGENFTKKTGIKVIYNSGGSGTLKKQIENGSNVDMFFSANTKYVEDLVKSDYIKSDEVYSILSNSLVIIGDKKTKNLNNVEELEDTQGKIGIGDINTVPAGIYAKQTLDKYNIWNKVKNRVVYARSVTAVKQYVESGEVKYGFVYGSDTIDLKNSKVILSIPSEGHNKIKYSLGILKNSKNKKEDLEFVEYLKSEEAKKIFKEYGFKVN